MTVRMEDLPEREAPKASNYFEDLNKINVNENIEKKGKFSYLSWVWAWAELKKRYPQSTYTIYENAQGWNYHTDGRTAWVKTGVTVNGIEHIEYLPVMDNNNRSLPLDRITSFEVNKSIQRSLTKAIGRHGLGLYIYAGEDLPEEPDKAPEKATAPKNNKTTPKATAKTTEAPQSVPQATATVEPEKVPAAKDDSARVELREFIAENDLDAGVIAAACEIGPKSTHEDYEAALDYAKNLARLMASRNEEDGDANN